MRPPVDCDRMEQISFEIFNVPAWFASILAVLPQCVAGCTPALTVVSAVLLVRRRRLAMQRMHTATTGTLPTRTLQRPARGFALGVTAELRARRSWRAMQRRHAAAKGLLPMRTSLKSRCVVAMVVTAAMLVRRRQLATRRALLQPLDYDCRCGLR